MDIVDKFDVAKTRKAIEISREEIAQYIGTGTQSLHYTIRDFEAEGFIDVSKGKIVTINKDKVRNSRSCRNMSC